MTDSIFRGIATALITPFRNGEVDYDTFGRLIDWQIENGIDALVICGTTGEGSTLSDEEHKACIRFAVERAAGRTVIIAGTGSNDTNYAINLTKYSCDVGADAMLVVTPYYNKATHCRCQHEADDRLQRPLPHGLQYPAADLSEAGGA